MVEGGSGGDGSSGGSGGQGGGIYYNQTNTQTASSITFAIGNGGNGKNTSTGSGVAGTTTSITGVSSGLISVPGGLGGLNPNFTPTQTTTPPTGALSGSLYVKGGIGGTGGGTGGTGGNGLFIDASFLVLRTVAGSNYYVGSGGGGGTGTRGGYGGSRLTGGGMGNYTSITGQKSVQIGGGGGASSHSLTSTIKPGAGSDGFVAIWIAQQSSQIGMTFPSSALVFSNFVVNITITTIANGFFTLTDNLGNIYVDNVSTPIASTYTISCNSINITSLIETFTPDYPDYFSDNFFTRTITILPATQTAFTFNIPSSSARVYNPLNKTLDLSSSLIGGTAGGTYSLIVNSIPVPGTILTYVNAGNYSVAVKSTVPNYTDYTSPVQTITITSAIQTPSTQNPSTRQRYTFTEIRQKFLEPSNVRNIWVGNTNLRQIYRGKISDRILFTA